MDGSLSIRLAQWLAALDWRALPPRQQELAHLRLLDTIGLMLAGARTPAGIIASDRAARKSPGKASAVGVAAPLSSGWAALANGVAAHCLDFDDTFPDSVVHPGSAVVPAALAVGEELGASGVEILTAIAGAYEIVVRLARPGARNFHQRGFHPSGIFAPIAAAFVAGKLMRLPAEATASAVGLAASMSGGLMAFNDDGSWAKSLHLGWGGMGGILAAQLAVSGFRGPLGALDGRHNLYSAFLAGIEVNRNSIEAGLGQDWFGETALFKLYPCAHVIHPYIDLALSLRRSRSIDPAAVASVICSVAPWAIAIVCEPRAYKAVPQTMVDAIASLPYQVAAALVDGRVGLATLDEASWRRDTVLDLARRVDYRSDAGLEGFAARIEIEMQDGRRFALAGRAAIADAARLGEKFRANAAPSLPEDQASRLADAIGRFAEAPDAGEIGALLRAAQNA